MEYTNNVGECKMKNTPIIRVDGTRSKEEVTCAVCGKKGHIDNLEGWIAREGNFWLCPNHNKKEYGW